MMKNRMCLMTIVLVIGTASLDCYQRECRIERFGQQDAPPFKGERYTYNVQLRADGQTLTPDNRQGAVIKVCYVQLTDEDREQLRTLFAGYSRDQELRNLVDKLDPLSMAVDVINDLTARFKYSQSGSEPTVDDLFDLIKK